MVVQPRQAQARGLPLGIVRAAVALIVVDTAPELGGAVFAQVVRQTLPDQAEPEAVFGAQSRRWRLIVRRCARNFMRILLVVSCVWGYCSIARRKKQRENVREAEQAD